MKKRNVRNTLIFGVILTIISPFIFTMDLSNCFSFSKTGDIGDTIGGITSPIVGLLGSVLVYYALKEQIKANKLINKQFKQQKRIQIRQNFEATFFNLLSIHHKNIDELEIETRNLKYNIQIEESKNSGNSNLDTFIYGFNEKYRLLDLNSSNETENKIVKREFFKYTLEPLKAFLSFETWKDELNNSQNPNLFYIKNLTKDMILNEIILSQIRVKKGGEEIISPFHTYFNSIYDFIYREHDSYLGHYFRSLYRLIRFIDEQVFLENDYHKDFEIKYFYTSIVRSQLSDYETQWLMYNCVSEFGNVKFKPLIEKYTLLKILENNKENSIVNIKSLYLDSAFKKCQKSKVKVD